MPLGALEFEDDSSEPSSEPSETESEDGLSVTESPTKLLKGPAQAEGQGLGRGRARGRSEQAPRKAHHAAKREDFVLDSSDDEAPSDGGSWIPSSESDSDNEGSNASHTSSPAPAATPAPTPRRRVAKQKPVGAARAMPAESVAARILKHEFPDWASDLGDLVNTDTFGDIDGWRIEFAPSAMDWLESLALGCHSVHVIGAKFAKTRHLYEPDAWAFVGLQRPEARQGMGIAIQRSKHANRTLAQIGEPVVIDGAELALTEAHIDEGIDQLHAYLSDHRRGQDWTVRGLERCAQGSHSIWESHKPIPIYKLLHACKVCGYVAPCLNKYMRSSLRC